jgi:hypothetical protein
MGLAFLPPTMTMERGRQGGTVSWMKVDAARKYAGGIGRKALYHAVASGQLKVARIGTGRSMLFHQQWIDEWLRGSAERAATGESATGDENIKTVGRRTVLRLVSRG